MQIKKYMSILGQLISLSIPLIACSQGGSSSSTTTQVNYPLVTIANPNNPNDPLTGIGSIDYTYQIGKYDVTISQYAAFLNAVAKTDKYFLYDERMATDLNSAGITRSGSEGNYSYKVMDNGGYSGNRPITYITWFNAARFANWMANGQPVGVEDSTTTENGAYNLNGAITGDAIAKNVINPNTGKAPSYYIPKYNEWYKAAYYSPKLNNGSGGYYLYATESNAAPGNVIGDKPNQANNFPSSTFSVTQSPTYLYATQNYLTDVGAFTNSSSYYGTFDQNGNVYQWNDLDGTPAPYRGLAGGYWFSGAYSMQATIYNTNVPDKTDNGVGFRLASPAQ